MKKGKRIRARRLKVFVEGSRGYWRTGFTIDQQTFYFAERTDKNDALWVAKVLRHAFRKMQFKSDKVTI